MCTGDLETNLENLIFCVFLIVFVVVVVLLGFLFCFVGGFFLIIISNLKS